MDIFRLHRDDETAGAVARLTIGIGKRVDDDMRRPSSIGGPALLASNNPAIAVACRRDLGVSSVGPTPRFGEAENEHALAGRQIREMRCLLRFCATELQRLRTQRERRARRDGQRLRLVTKRQPHQQQVQLRTALSAIFLRDSDAEQSHFGHLCNGVIRNQLVSSLPLQPARRDSIVNEVVNRLVKCLLLLSHQPL